MRTTRTAREAGSFPYPRIALANFADDVFVPIDNRPFPRIERCPACRVTDIWRLNTSGWEVCDACWWELMYDAESGLTLAQILGMEDALQPRTYRGVVRVVTYHIVETLAMGEDDAHDALWKNYEAGVWIRESEGDAELQDVGLHEEGAP